jgi:RNA recognition motif-containing protein
MAKKLFVGGLSWNTTSEQLKAAFEAIGPVTDAVVITDRETGRSRGFGFVTYANDADGDKALADLSGTMLDGRAIKVDAATERAPGGGGGRGPGGPPRSFGPPRRPVGAPPSFGGGAPGGGGPPRTGGGGGGGGGGRGPDRPRRYEQKDRRDREGMRQKRREDEAPKAGDYLDDEY